jgi:hypothetical protein
MRRSAGDAEVGGRVRLAFEWDITARGLLALKLAALERVLVQPLMLTALCSRRQLYDSSMPDVT